MTAPILVAGATGYLGRFIVAELHRRGHRVRAITRSRSRAASPGPWEAPALDGLVDEWAVGDVTDPAFTADVAKDVDKVISALGVTKQKASPWDIDYRANLAILRSAEQYGARSFCFVNVIGGDRCPAQLTKAKTTFAQKLAASTISSQIINPPGYFSDMAQILRMAKRGRAYLFRPNTRINPIHGADLAEFCVDRLVDSEKGEWNEARRSSPGRAWLSAHSALSSGPRKPRPCRPPSCRPSSRSSESSTLGEQTHCGSSHGACSTTAWETPSEPTHSSTSTRATPPTKNKGRRSRQLVCLMCLMTMARGSGAAFRTHGPESSRPPTGFPHPADKPPSPKRTTRAPLDPSTSRKQAHQQVPQPS